MELVDEIILIAGGEIQLQGKRDLIWPQIKESSICPCRKNCPLEGEINVGCPR